MEIEPQVPGATSPAADELDLDDVALEPTEDPEELKARLEKETEARRQLTARAKRAEEEVKTLKAKELPTAPKPDDTLVKDVEGLKLAETKRQFGYEHQLSPQETDNLFRFANGRDPAETFKDPFFQAGLKESRRQQKVDDAVPSGTGRSPRVAGKTFGEMTAEERRANWDKIVKK
jgi:hypothetical protein